jgi:hypothetical protein
MHTQITDDEIVSVIWDNWDDEEYYLRRQFQRQFEKEREEYLANCPQYTD